LQEIAIYLDYKKDESYTPQRMIARIGSSFHDIKDVKTVEFTEPSGWNSITFSNKDDEDEDQEESNKKESIDYKIIRTNMIQLVIEANHQNGRDTHVRQIKIYGPSNNSSK
jgi:anaphase-promoting complex subunit 10